MIRKAVVSGSFYPAGAGKLIAEIERHIDKDAKKEKAVGALAPHAGYIYSGPVAGALYSRILIPPTVVILAPDHRGSKVPFALWAKGKWDTPLGQVPVNEKFASILLDNSGDVKEDTASHLYEHSAEVHVPFLSYLRRDVSIVPVVISCHNLETLKRFGQNLAKAVNVFNEEVLIVASSDMTHYESQESATEKDMTAIGSILVLDEDGLFNTVRDLQISMCGVAPAVSMLACVKELGVTIAELIKYQTSGDVTGDFSKVVGYAGIRLS